MKDRETMNEFEINLSNMLSDMEAAEDLYKPTNFWSSGLPDLIKDIEKLGVENFRSHPSAAFFYVPVYASNTMRKWGNFLVPLANYLPSRKKARLLRRLSRSDRAWLDYRIFKATSVKGGIALDGVSESDVGGGERFAFDRKSYSRSMLNYLRALNLYKREAESANLSSILEIGGGYGTLGEILLKSNPDGFYVNVDIPPVAAVSTYYLQQVFGKENVLTYTESRDLDVIDLDVLKARYKAVVLCPWQLPKLIGTVDLFANFMSFQEMEPDVVSNYINYVQPLVSGHVLVRNSALGKKTAKNLGDVGVIEQVKSAFIRDAFDAFECVASDAFVYGEENETGSYQSEVSVLRRR
jgi:putative sugar O-methyltransferase